jgi:hypothetical protein
MSMDYVLYDLPMEQGWALQNASFEEDGWLQFAQVKREGKGYIFQERDRLMRMVQA